MILVIENNRLQTITVTLSFQTYTISIDTPIDYKKNLYTKTFGFIDYDCPNPWSSKKKT